MNSNEMIEVRIAYKFHVEARTRSARNSEGTYNYVESDEYCDGLHTNIENIFFNLQDYEIFIGIEKKYRPQEHDHSSSGPIYNLYDKEDSDSYYDYYRSDNRLVYELNEALSERLKVFFVAAKEEEKLEYNIFKSINSDIFNEFERERDNVIEITKSEIKEIKKQILDLEKRKDWLESESYKKGHCASAVRSSIKTLVEQNRININEKIPYFDIYPLQIAENYGSIELYEFLVKHGARFYGKHPLLFHCWFGFFKFYNNIERLNVKDHNLILHSLFELSDSELKTLFLDEKPQFNFRGLVIKEDYIFAFRRFFIEYYYENDKADDGMRHLLEVLIKQKRYDAIEIFNEISYWDPHRMGLEYICNPLIFMDDELLKICIKLKDLDSLKRLSLEVDGKIFNETHMNSMGGNASEFYKKYCNEEYLGKEMMDYINTHKVD